jgi:hypothetical protein
VAVHTSVRAVLASPVTVPLWGMIVAASLTIGFLLRLIGLVFLVSVLAHATWHLYRRVRGTRVATPEQDRHSVAARIHWQRPQSTGKLKPIRPSGVPFHDHSIGTQGEPVAAMLTSGKGDALLNCCEGNHQDNGRADWKLPIAAPN